MGGDPGRHLDDDDVRMRRKLGMESGQPTSRTQTRVDDPKAPDPEPHAPGHALGQAGAASPKERRKTKPSARDEQRRRTGDKGGG